MNNIYEAQTADLLKELKDEMIPVYNWICSMDPRARERFLDRLTLLSGISGERLHALLAYSNEAASESAAEEYGPTLQEMHAFCNSVSLSVPFISEEDIGTEGDDMAYRCEALINRWSETVNRYLNRWENVFTALIPGSEAASTEEFFSTYHIFMDSTILCDEKLADVLQLLISEIKKAENPLKVTVPETVVSCLKELDKDEEQRLLFGTGNGLRNLQKLQTADSLSVRGDSADATSMSTFLSAFSRYKPVYKMALFTQDEALAKAVQMLNKSGLEGSEIIICRLNEDDTFSLWFGQETEGTDTDSPDEKEEALSDPPAAGTVRIAEPDEDTEDEESPAGADAGTDSGTGEVIFEKDPVPAGTFFEKEPEDLESVVLPPVPDSLFSAKEEKEPEAESMPDVTVWDDLLSGDDGSEDLDDGRNTPADLDNFETDIEKLSMLEAELASIGISPASDEEEDDDEGLSDDDDFDVDDFDDEDFEEDDSEEDDIDGEDFQEDDIGSAPGKKDVLKGALDLDFSEEDTLIADPVDFDTWNELN